uniref:Uncharacterized protein n=1 Tax=Romanomermis culicivorax TaxID=13658 RepID=A0A915L8T3_ROMCU
MHIYSLFSPFFEGRSTKQALHLYLRFKDQLFEGWTRPYNSEKLEKSLKNEMGENTTLADVQKFRLMIVATSADVQPIKLHAFRSYMLPTSLEENKKYGYDAPEV